MADSPFFYVHCDIPPGEPLRSVRDRVPRRRFVARMIAQVGDRRIAFFAPRKTARQPR